MKLDRDELKEFSKRLFPYKDPARVMDVLEYVEKAEILIKEFKNPVVVAAIQKLWSSEIMTADMLAEMTGEPLARVKRIIKDMEKLGIVKQETRGIYGRGDNSYFMMNIFAHIVVQLIPEDELDDTDV